jgi:hypothetical protein
MRRKKSVAALCAAGSLAFVGASSAVEVDEDGSVGLIPHRYTRHVE